MTTTKDKDDQKSKPAGTPHDLALAQKKAELLEVVVAALPRCSVCEGNGVSTAATRFRSVGFGRWYLFDQHGAREAELRYAAPLRALVSAGGA